MPTRPIAAPRQGDAPQMDASPTCEAASGTTRRLAENLARVRARIEHALAACGRPAGGVRLMAVTKYATAEGVAALVASGLRDFGENYVQAALAKQEAMTVGRSLRGPSVGGNPSAGPPVGGGPVRWHLIGPLQTNKARMIPGRFASVRTIDRTKLIDALARYVDAAGTRLTVQLQLNTTGEASKSGCEVGLAPSLARAVMDTGVLDLDGLMTIGPTDGAPDATAAAFRALDCAARDLEDSLGRPLARSMGMSHDLEAAVAAGATEVRIGGALFEGLTELRADVGGLAP